MFKDEFNIIENTRLNTSQWSQMRFRKIWAYKRLNERSQEDNKAAQNAIY